MKPNCKVQSLPNARNTPSYEHFNSMAHHKQGSWWLSLSLSLSYPSQLQISRWSTKIIESKAYLQVWLILTEFGTYLSSGEFHVMQVFVSTRERSSAVNWNPLHQAKANSVHFSLFYSEKRIVPKNKTINELHWNTACLSNMKCDQHLEKGEKKTCKIYSWLTNASHKICWKKGLSMKGWRVKYKDLQGP